MSLKRLIKNTGLPIKALCPAVLKTTKNNLPLSFQVYILKAASMIANNPDWRAYLGVVREKLGDYEKAIDDYQAAIEKTDNLNAHSFKPKRQAYQFNLEKIFFDLGTPRVEDPLHFCKIYPGDPASQRVNKKTAGDFKGVFNYNGIHMKAVIKDTSINHFDYCIDDRPFRRIKNIKDTSEYTYTIKRQTLEHFPVRGEITAKTDKGDNLLFKGSEKMILEVPYGKNDLSTILDKFTNIGKKGDIPVSEEEINRRQDAYLKLYDRAKDFFDKEIGTPLFLIYGTLLGLYRDGDFIKGDDDFDVAYFSRENEPSKVKEETKEIIMKLARNGFTVSFNQIGRPFRLREAGGEAELHLDARPVWYEQNRIWAHKQACLPLVPEDFLPVKKDKMRGVDVYLPNKPAAFLEAYYGKGWKVPDPAYSNEKDAVSDYVHNNLSRLCLTIGEIREMKENLQKENYSGSGDIIYKGIENLYPLEEYERKCGWH